MSEPLFPHSASQAALCPGSTPDCERTQSISEAVKSPAPDPHGSLRSLVSLILSVSILSCVPIFAAESPLASSLRLPCGPPGPGRFGAYWTRLNYTSAWDRRWRNSVDADVVVRFDAFSFRFVFWRGASYVPCWAGYDGPWFSNEFFERPGGAVSGTYSMVEPMSDKQCRYSQVRIIENNDARTVIQWRYAPTDLDYDLAFVNNLTHWGDWADEFYTIYPDGVGVRKATLYSSALNEWIEYQESIVINQPGAKPEDSLSLTAVTLANLAGETKNYTWSENGAPDFRNPPRDTCIQLVNTNAKFKPFTIFNPDGATCSAYGGHAPGSHFNCWNHWPVSEARSDTTVATTTDRPSHTSLSHLKWKPYATNATSMTWIHLHGMTDLPAAGLVTLAKSWLHAPSASVVSRDYLSRGYDPAQRAYVFQARTPAKPAVFEVRFSASHEQPVLNPCLVIRNWGNGGAALKVGGRDVPRGKSFRFGHRDTLEGRDLIVWIKVQSTRPLRVSLIPR